jgi:hypothetical protein
METQDKHGFNANHPELDELGKGWEFLGNLSGLVSGKMRNEALGMDLPDFRVVPIDDQFEKLKKRAGDKAELKLGTTAFHPDGRRDYGSRPVFMKKASK